MNKYLRILLSSFLALLVEWNSSAQPYYAFDNSVDGVDICLYQLEKWDFGIANVFEFSVDGTGFKADLSNLAEASCRISAGSYLQQHHFEFKDGKVYTFTFFLHLQDGTLTQVKENVLYYKPKLYSLSIGINKDGLLRNAQQSAAEFNNICKDSFFSPQYAKGQSYLIAPADCSPRSLDEKFSQIAKEARPNDLILIYFAGHGQIDTEGNYSLCLNDGQSYSSISIREKLNTLATEAHKIIIACTCYSTYLWDAIFSVPNTVLIAASDHLTDGESFARNFLSLLEASRNKETLFSEFTDKLLNDNPEARVMPFLHQADFILSYAPDTSTLSTGPTHSKVKPALLSAVVPGAGQFYKKDYLKGALFTGGALLSGTGIIVCESLRKNYLRQAAQTYDVNVINSLSAKAGHLRTASYILIAGTGILYLGSILDAAFSPYPDKKGFHVSPNGVSYRF
ncbi:MAG: caspase family protein [Bacteroidales bacterium]|nr:caspase family protein [Bacteroidales bacterium]